MHGGMETQVMERPRVAARPTTSVPRETAAKAPAPLSYLSTAEVAECTCPEPCERDHDRD